MKYVTYRRILFSRRALIGLGICALATLAGLLATWHIESN